MKLTLHGYWRSSASWRVRIGLALKGCDFATVPVHLLANGGEQRAGAFRELNPMQQVPALVVEHEGATHVLTQSLPILEWLDETFPTPPLLPRDSFARAHVRRLAEIVNAGIQPLQNLSVTQRLDSLGVPTAPWLAHFVAHGLDALEECAARQAGAFLYGDAPTLADLCLVPQLASARRFRVPVDAYPTLLRAEAACLALEAFQQAAPERQPDAVAS